MRSVAFSFSVCLFLNGDEAVQPALYEECILLIVPLARFPA